MTELEQLDRARSLAEAAHAGQVDRGGNPYQEHLAAVAGGCTTICEQTVAWLHDIVEDTDVDIQRLREEGFSEEVVEAVSLLTKHYDDSFDYKTYLTAIRRNPLACAVKLSDLKHNMDTSRLKEITADDLLYQEKYRVSDAFLRGQLAEDVAFPKAWSKHNHGRSQEPNLGEPTR
ncbi:MAG: GTP pyrophosphokinase [Lachnospiraceae bacterium]|nr:GTP pyrophosphokinase [Lachnospiraceae bacterium]